MMVDFCFLSGTQYRSAIFYHSEEQKKIAHEVLDEYQKTKFPNAKIVTEISPASTSRSLLIVVFKLMSFCSQRSSGRPKTTTKSISSRIPMDIAITGFVGNLTILVCSLLVIIFCMPANPINSFLSG